MTAETIMIEISGNVIRIGGTVEIGQVAGVTITCSPFELSVLMAIAARYSGVRTEQRECGRRMTEGGWFPSIHSVTRKTFVRELTGHMVGTGDGIEFSLMTTIAVRRETFELSVGMTRHTRCGRMGADERECRCAVIECRWFPSCIGMTRNTIMRKERRYMVRRYSCSKIILMTAVTIGRGPFELSIRMTRSARDRSVCTDQRERCCTVIECRWLPSVHRMTGKTVV